MKKKNQKSESYYSKEHQAEVSLRKFHGYRSLSEIELTIKYLGWLRVACQEESSSPA